jgi:hypothetical protein
MIEHDSEMARYMAEGYDETWYCEHGYYQGYDCPDCNVPSYLPSLAETLVSSDPALD